MKDIFDLKWLEDHAYLDSLFHRLHEVIKIILLLLFVIKVTMIPYTQIFVLAKLILLLAVSMHVAKIRFMTIFKRTIPGLIFAGFFAISYFFSVSGSLALYLFVGMLVKTFLTIGIVLVVVATTGIDAIIQGLMWLRVPKLLLFQFYLTYRYLGRFIDRVAAMSLSNNLRSQRGGLQKEVWGAFLGHLFLGAMNDALMVQQSLELRGFYAKEHLIKTDGPSLKQWLVAALIAFTIFID